MVEYIDGEWIINGYKWGRDAVRQALADAKACMESRRTRKPCDCVCCQIYRKSRGWK